MFSKLQYISQGSTAKEQIENIQSILDAGYDWVLLRFKNADEKEYIKVAKQVKTICLSYKATFIPNDYVELAISLDANGVLLGLKDMPITQARAILGANKIIGGTANSLVDVLQPVAKKYDYIGMGPLRFTTTKVKLSPVLGIGGYEIIMNEISKRETYIPIYAIGGVMTEDLSPLMNSGVYGVAVSGAITNHSNKKEKIQLFNSLLHGKINNSR